MNKHLLHLSNLFLYSYSSNKPKRRKLRRWSRSLRSTRTLETRRRITKKCRMSTTTFWKKEWMKINNQQLKFRKVKKRYTHKKRLIRSTQKISKLDFNLPFLKKFRGRYRKTMPTQSFSKCKMISSKWLRARAQPLPS